MSRPRGYFYKKTPNYRTAHLCVQIIRGWASAYNCVDCGERAAEWSYDGQDEEALIEVRSGRELPYSTDPERYQPRCLSCHCGYDKREWGGVDGLQIDPRCGTRAGWNVHKRGGTQPCTGCREANRDYMRAYRKRKEAA